MIYKSISRVTHNLKRYIRAKFVMLSVQVLPRSDLQEMLVWSEDCQTLVNVHQSKVIHVEFSITKPDHILGPTKILYCGIRQGFG